MMLLIVTISISSVTFVCLPVGSVFQLRKFSELQFKDGKDMVDTFRPVQPLNRRVVYRSGGAVALASAALLMASVAMAMGLSQPN